MSLQIWLPLNGNINNQGLLNVSLSGSPVYTDGKIGKCLVSPGLIACSSSALNYNKFTIAFWFKCKSGFSGDWKSLVSIYTKNVGNGTSGSLRFEQASSSSYYRTLSTHNNASYDLETGSTVYSTTADIWNHVVYIYNGDTGNVTTYLNGNFKDTRAGKTGGQLNGYFNIGGSYEGWINDFRIYDHCLSAKEVKEISKGLVCHYKLSGCGGYNIAKNTSTKLILTSKGGTNENTGSPTVSNFGGDPYELIGSLPDLLTENDYITFSYDWKVTTVTSSGLSGNFKGGVNASPWECTGSIVLSDTNRSGRCVYTAKAGTMATSTATRVRFRMDNIPSGTVIEISNLKFEKSNSPTPWCPATSDTMYTTLGYNNNIEYDCSGYGNHGTKSGTITWSSDTPRYSGSYAFNASTTNGDRIVNSTGFPIGTFPTFTINFWYKPKIGKTFGQWRDICGTNCFRLESCNTTGTNYNWFGGFANAGGLSGFNMNTEKWYMVTLVSNSSTMYQYLDGSLIASRTLGSDYVSWVTNGSFYIGEADMYFNISDFRIYATALSADDIKALYNTSASVDKSGNLYAYEFKEE